MLVCPNHEWIRGNCDCSEAQFTFSATAVIFVLFPTILASKKTQIFGGAVLILSLDIAITGYTKYINSPYMQSARANSGSVVAPVSSSQTDHK